MASAQQLTQSVRLSSSRLVGREHDVALLTIREGKKVTDLPQLQEAVQRVLAGPQRRGHLLTADERQRVAHHEVGHAVVAAALGRAGDIRRVSIVARGRGLGQSTASSDADRSLLTRGEIEDQMAMSMGGLCAEKMRFQEARTAAEDDVEKVTQLAHQMVGRFGMSDALGTRRLLPSDTDLYLSGGEAGAMVHVSEETMAGYDVEIKRLIEGAKTRATELLTENGLQLQRMVDGLVTAETLEGGQLDIHLAGVKVSAPRGAVSPPSANGSSMTGGTSSDRPVTPGSRKGSPR